MSSAITTEPRAKDAGNILPVVVVGDASSSSNQPSPPLAPISPYNFTHPPLLTG